MLIEVFPTSAWQSNCYVLATQSQADCLIIDPGPGAFSEVNAIIEKFELNPVGVLLTHGHPDHMGDVEQVCAHYQIPCWVHPGDRELLAHPEKGLGCGPEVLAQAIGRDRVNPPADVRDLLGNFMLAGLSIEVREAPGHTGGCVLLLIEEHCFSGDVLFAGAIGRVDLPTSSVTAMQSTLQMIMELPDELSVYPGHGPSTSIGIEKRSNPFLR